VLNRDDQYLEEISKEAIANKIYFSLAEIDCNNCVFIKEGNIVFKKDVLEDKIAPLKNLKLRGHHNTYNALAAVGAGIVLGIKKEDIGKALATCQGAPHRLEFVREINGVQFYNDSAATVPEAAIAGINAFLKPIHLICGGASKNLDFSEFARKISHSKYVKNIYLLEGTATEKIKELIIKEGGQSRIKNIYKNINLATGEAFREAKKDEVVLLSPACASFGMFKNEFDRGNKFKEAVNVL
jgi:UDP-N-acetylmuramoylalanine--D-glutamate ligase